MSENTIHSGKGTRRGVIIAAIVLALFVGGIAMLGNGSAPVETPEEAPAATN